MTESDKFIANLKRFNVKERNFLMRYALSESISQKFTSNLVNHLKQIGLDGVDGAKVAYFGMDFHLEWIEAALLLTIGKLTLDVYGQSGCLPGGQKGRIEDVDLLVVLEKADHNLVMVLVEAKGVDVFDTSQFESKAKRLERLYQAAFDPNDKRNATEWLTPIMLFMSPGSTKPSVRTCEKFQTRLASRDPNEKKVDFWPAAASSDPNLVWIELKGFFSEVGDINELLRIRTCYGNGTVAPDIHARTKRPYDHWRVERRNR